jgi:hypothetical protein
MRRILPVLLIFLAGVLLGGIAGWSIVSAQVNLNLTGKLEKRAGPTAARDVVQKKSGPVILDVVKENEFEEALATMDLAPETRQRIVDDVKSHKYRLLWLTLWDWDGDGPVDHITLVSGAYQRKMGVPKARERIAIPDPPATYVEIIGDPSGPSWVTLGLLSGSCPIALERVEPGSAIRIDVDASN